MKAVIAVILYLYSWNSFADQIGSGAPPSSLPNAVQNVGASATPADQTYGDFRDSIQQWDSSRGLFAIPTSNTTGFQASVCHSGHYSPDLYPLAHPNSEEPETPRGDSVETLDTYTTLLGGCVYMAVLQEWRQKYCKNGGGCMVALGDVSHKTLPKFNGIKSHQNGKCFNVKPMQKGSQYQNVAVDYNSDIYDAAMTRKFIQLLRDKGIRTVWFNDASTGARHAPGLDKVINFCVEGSDAEEKTCKDFKYDASICGENGTVSL